MSKEPVDRKSLVFFAMREEAATFKRSIASAKAHLLITGIGARNAECAARAAMDEWKPELVLTCGFAGGLNPELSSGAVVFSTNDSRMESELRLAGAKPAKFYCSSRIATTAAEKAELRRTTGADAVEMESELIQNLCRERGIPCATVRVISDTASEDLPLDFNALANADLSLNYFKLALAIAKSPGRIAALLRLQKKCLVAAERLSAVLGKVVRL